MKCRHCGAVLQHTFIDLGFAPPSNAYLRQEDLARPEVCFPLRVKVCDQCWLVQTEDYARSDELFSADYPYFSSTSSGWLAHASEYCKHITGLLRLDQRSLVVEVASNDGYLLRNFVDASIPCLGIEPTSSTAAAAEALGIPVLREFFRLELALRLAAERGQANLIVGNNVYAHVPDINDFTRGLAAMLKPEGVVTLEFPHIMQLIEYAQFDTIYHEHFSYLSLGTLQRIFAVSGLRVWDVEELPTHGGSLRVYGCRTGAKWMATKRVDEVLAEEQARGLERLETYSAFQATADRVKDDMLAFLIEKKRAGKRIAAYGAAAKGNTLLNYAGVKADLLPYVCDAAPKKQGKYLPGSHLPIFAPQRIFDDPPDIVLILPWNLRTEFLTVLEPLIARGTQVYVAVPSMERVS